MNAHTPGPWHIGDRQLIESEGNLDIAQCLTPFPFATSNAEREANARLIAAAPDLLAIVEELVVAGISYNSAKYAEVQIPHGVLTDARAALAKAKGE